MQDYDIRLFNQTGALSLSTSGNYASDFAAIRAAEHLCREHEKFEVWNGTGCIFASTPRGESSPDSGPSGPLAA